MTDRKRLLLLAITGAIVVVGALGLRKQILSHRHPVGTTTSEQKEFVRLHTAVEAKPSDPASHWALAKFYRQVGLTKKTGEELNIITQLTPDDMEARCALGDTCLLLGRYPQAEYDYRTVVKKSPQAILAWQGLAAVMIKERRFYEACLAANRAITLNKNDPNAHLLLATGMVEYASQFPDPLSHSGDLKYARKDLERSLKVFPNNAQVYYELGRACLSLRDKSHAIPYLEHAYQLAPQSGEIARMLAIAYRTSGRSLEAQKIAQDLIRQEPNFAMNYDLLGESDLDLNTPDAVPNAVKACEQAVKLAPNDPYLNERLGMAYIRNGNYPEARTVLEHVVQLTPRRDFAHLKLAEVYTRLGDLERAKQETKKGEELSQLEQNIRRTMSQLATRPADVNLHMKLAPMLSATGSFDAARDEYLTALKLDPKNPKIPKGLVKAVAEQSGF